MITKFGMKIIYQQHPHFDNSRTRALSRTGRGRSSSKKPIFQPVSLSGLCRLSSPGRLALRSMTRKHMQQAPRIILYLHIALAIYCLVCGGLDAIGLFQTWMIPNIVVFYALLLSTPILLVTAISITIIAKPRYGRLGVFVHLVSSLFQLIGIFSLIT